MNEKLTIGIDGMTCASCVRRVEQALQGLPGVVRASVNLATEKATVEMEAKTPLAAVLEAVRAAGYEPRLTSDELTIEGMTCA
uniref:heavy-metal-associated domain-containing protein n=1 Tax=Oceanithermus sp. TaxID=2268145 RepID=UPI0025EDF847